MGQKPLLKVVTRIYFGDKRFYVLLFEEDFSFPRAFRENFGKDYDILLTQKIGNKPNVDMSLIKNILKMNYQRKR